MTTTLASPGRARLVPMLPRDPRQPGRTASSLELFFDLVFVVAVSVAAVELHHELTEGHVLDGVASYARVFFAIWWAWMNFSWFATSFDTDDWLYRVTTVVQMAGVLVLAAGVHDAFEGDFTLPVVGYVIMRLAMVSQWLRAAHHDGDHRRTALTYAAGISVVQLLWVVLLILPESAQPVAFLLLVAAELAVPVIAEQNGATPWHRHHITERYGLFTLILLGESLLASANAIIDAVGEEEAQLSSLVAVALLALVVTAALWWIYFWPPHHRAIDGGLRRSLRYGYVHYFVFAAAGAFSAGVEVEIDVLTHHSELSEVAASFTVTVPVAIFVLGIWWLAIRENADRVVNVVVPAGALLVLLDPVVPIPVALTTFVMVVIVAVLVLRPPVEAGEPVVLAGDRG